MKFFSFDQDISVIKDVSHIFAQLGHQIDRWSGSHTGSPLNKLVDIVNQHTWHTLNQESAEAFYQQYKSLLDHYDGFIVTYPSSFALLFEHCKKPIIFYVPVRYEAPFHTNAELWKNFNRSIQQLIDGGLLIPLANNLYDKNYCEHFIRRPFQHIPSIGSNTMIQYNPVLQHFLYSSHCKLNLNSRLIIDKDTALNPQYEWQSLGLFQGCIHIPSNCSYMNLFEHYNANIPLFFPSRTFLLELYKTFNTCGVLSNLSWNQVYNLPSGSQIRGSTPIDPNNVSDFSMVQIWIQYADYYSAEWMPFIQYFDSIDDLYYRINHCSVTDISESMKTWNRERQHLIVEKWRKIVDTLR